MKTLQPVRYLLLLISAFLSVIGILWLTRLGEKPDMAGWYAVLAFSMIMDSAIVLACYFWLKKKSKRAFQVSMFILLLNMVLTIFDQIGFVDILFVILNVAALVLLYLSRKEFTSVN
ncbi:MAG: hypothetical protein H6634_08180 [Anaerolineales bacterium]|nr:hypothetical protein [Anaerolineales bacterium]